jgi:hypothetical protein
MLSQEIYIVCIRAEKSATKESKSLRLKGCSLGIVLHSNKMVNSRYQCFNLSDTLLNVMSSLG